LVFILEQCYKGPSLLNRKVIIMTKIDLISTVQKSNKGLSKRAIEDVVDTAISTLAKAIKREGRFAYPGFGVFTVRTRKARQGRRPKTGEVITIKPSKTVGFRPAPALKKSL
jgi:DNA-binding protein HU-beta